MPRAHDRRGRGASNGTTLSRFTSARRRRRSSRLRRFDQGRRNNPTPLVQVSRRGGQDALLEFDGWFDRPDGAHEHGQHAAELHHLGMRFGAGRQVLAHGGHLGIVERAQHERRGEVAHVVAAELADGGLMRIGHGDNSRRMASSPRRIRLFTVPSGVPVRTAISTCVRPPK